MGVLQIGVAPDVDRVGLGDLNAVADAINLIWTVLLALNNKEATDVNNLLAVTSGTPADTPPSGTVRVDSTNNKLWLYNGSAWKSVLLT